MDSKVAVNTDINTQEIIMSQFETPKLPEVKFSKNGYEIRTDVLSMAKDAVMEEYHSKFKGWEMSVERDAKTGQVVTKVGMPEFPGLDKIMEAAEKFYGFVNTGTKK
jgi:isocitrate dehydrogenase